MKSLHLFMSVLICNFVASISIITAGENQSDDHGVTPLNEHGVTPLSPKKAKDDLTGIEIQAAQHPVSPLTAEDLDRDLNDIENGGFPRIGSFRRSQSSVGVCLSQGLPSSSSLGSLADIYAALATSPTSLNRRQLGNLSANIFPGNPANPTCHHGVTPIK